MLHRFLLIAGTCVACFSMNCKTSVDPNFIEYLKAEQGLRDRLNDSPALGDSLAALERSFGIDREAELDFLKDHPEQWVQLLKALRNEK